MQTPMRGACSLVIAILFLSSRQAARAEDSDAIGARLQRVDAATALDASGVAPWHMKMSVQLLDAQGQPTEQGLIEEWWSGPTRDRVVYALPSYKATELQTEAGFFRTKGAEQPPLMLELLREQVVHPMPAARELEGAKPEVRKEKFGKAPLECIMLDRPIKAVAFFPIGLFPTYCMDAGKESLRASYDYGSQMILRNEVEDFQGKAVAWEISVDRGSTPAAKAQVFKLEAKAGEDALFIPGDELASIGARPLRVGAATMAFLLLSKVNPKYPGAAKASNATGTVTLQAVIGRDGVVKFVRVVAAPTADLGDAAMLAVKQWIYKPYRLDGAAIEVETTMIVSFTSGS
jgi:TonB family protein